MNKKSIIGAIGLALVLAVAVISQSKGQQNQPRQTHSSVFIYCSVSDDPNGFYAWDISASGPDAPHIERGKSLAELDAQLRDAGFNLLPQAHPLMLHWVK